MRVSRHAFIAIGAVWFCLAGLVPATASAFGTVNILNQRGEHERITRLALGCRAGQPHDGSCFEPASLDNLAGTGATFGAVGAPDDIPLRLWGGPPYWHCDDADYLNVPDYPQSRAKATQVLDECRQWARDMLFDGRPNDTTGRTWPVQGAVAEASTLLNRQGNVDVADPGTGTFSPGCTYNGRLGRAKCNVWEPFGYVLHTTEDFYSHSNWADLSNPNQPISITNPPGLGHRDLPAFWDLRTASAALPDPELTTGCFPTSNCPGRITHDAGLNKDKELINVTTGFVTDPLSPRAQIADNAQRAVNDAIGEARRQWAIFRFELVKHYGDEHGGKMICALTSDSSNNSCNNATRARDVFAAIPPAFVQLASVLNGRECFDDPNPGTANHTRVQMRECNGSRGQQFRFSSEHVQFTSTGTGKVKVVGKCLDAPSPVVGTHIEIDACNAKPILAQNVAVTRTGELEMLGMCLTNDNAPNGAAVILVPCNGTPSQIWQFR
jgi:Ricin-type beta-trefoil lectin domain